MSGLVDGTSAYTVSPSAMASMPMRRRDSAISSGEMSFPMKPAHSDADMLQEAGERSGDRYSDSPAIVTAPMDPPLSAIAVTTMSRAVFTALPSIPVTSMNRFFVSVVTVVRVPLITGGKESTSPLASVMIGYLVFPSRR